MCHAAVLLAGTGALSRGSSIQIFCGESGLSGAGHVDPLSCAGFTATVPLWQERHGMVREALWDSSACWQYARSRRPANPAIFTPMCSSKNLQEEVSVTGKRWDLEEKLPRSLFAAQKVLPRHPQQKASTKCILITLSLSPY